MPTDADLIRRDIVAVCQRLYLRGFIGGTDGDVGAAMRRGEAALLENHGSVTVGPSLQAAFNRMEIVERAAQVLYLAKLLGRVQPLSPEAVAALQALRS